MTPLAPADTSADPDRPLVIGYLSPDFREHAVARFFEPLLAAHDRRRHRILLYSECPIVDAVGTRLRGYGDTWQIVRGQSAETVAKQVQADSVDILIDLAGHTRDNRLDVLAYKPAPVQCTFLGYPYPTGLPRVDYRITDPILDPLDAPARTGFGESLLRLPAGVCCFRMPDAMPPVRPLPLATSGRLTFGCHHPLTKLNKPLLTLWARIAEAVPNARFLAIRSNWDPASIREARALMASAGLTPDRVEIRKTTIAPSEYLEGFHEMDVVLDAVPFNGHTMTCEALAMGVPVLTLRGDRPAGRLAASVLTAIGLTEFIAESADDYVAKAIALPDQAAHLAAVRLALRDRVGAVLGDGARYARALESQLRDAWRSWCRSRHHAASQSRS